MLYTEKLNENKVFLTLYKKGTFIPLRHVVLYVRPNRLAVNRLGITAGKKVGNAVKRNRAKRLIREAYRAQELNMPIGMDLVVVARASIDAAKPADISAQLGGRGLREITAALNPSSKTP